MTPLPSSHSVVPESVLVNQELPVLENVFQLLASLFRYPDEPLWQALAEALPAADTFLSGLLGHSLSLPPRHSLEQTYTALFCSNPYGLPAPPYLSCYLEESGRIEGDSTLEVRQLLAQEGLVVDPLLKEPEDHLSVLLELAGLLCHKAHGDNAVEAAEGRIRLLQLSDRMLIMLPPFQSAIAAADLSCVDFYVDAATLCLCLTVHCREQIQLKSATIEKGIHACRSHDVTC